MVRTIKGVKVPIGEDRPPSGNGGKKAVVGAAVFLCLAGLAGSGAVGATAVSASAESVAGQSIQVRTTNGKNAARRGRYDEAWRRMGLRALKQEVKRELREQECAAHSYGQVREFFLRTPCRSLERTLLAIGDGQGNTVVVSIAWVRMRNMVSAQQLKELVDTDGTGNVYPIASQVLELRGVQFNGQHYASRRSGPLVVIAEAAPGSGQPDTEVRLLAVTSGSGPGVAGWSAGRGLVDCHGQW